MIKKQNGIILSDGIVAVLIILLFCGIITSLMVNIVLESSKVKMNSQQIDFATELFEYVDGLAYDNVTEEKLINYINKKDISEVSAGTSIDAVSNPDAAYKISIQVETYEPEDESLPKLDIIKLVTLTIENNLNGKTYSTTMSTIKKATKEEIIEKVENMNNT